MLALRVVGLLATAPLLLGTAQAQLDTEAAPVSSISPSGAGSQVGLNASLRGGSFGRALGSVLGGPWDTGTYPLPPPGDNRELGVEHLDSSFFVSGRGDTTLGDNYRIHRFDENNPPPSTSWYMGSWPQTTQSIGWAGRDMESNDSNILWVGSDNGEVSEYGWDGVNLTWIQYYNYGIPDTFRAFAATPSWWYTSSFSGDIWECFPASATGGVNAQISNPGLTNYGAGYDSCNDTIWWWSQDGPVGQEVTATEWDHNTQNLTGRFFMGALVGGTNTAGGADVYVDSTGSTVMVGLHQATPDSITVYEICSSGPSCNPVFYCTPKTSSGGCVPVMQTQGPPPLAPNTGCPVTGACDYDVIAINVEVNKPGIIFYGYAPAAIPFQGGFLCVKPPIKRTPPQSSGGSAACSGSLTYTVNCPGDPPGTFTYFQAWFRDPMSASGTGLSDAVELQFQ